MAGCNILSSITTCKKFQLWAKTRTCTKKCWKVVETSGQKSLHEDVWGTWKFWRALNEKNSAVGVERRQRNLRVLFVNTAGGKWEPVITGKYAKPHFTNLKDIKHPYGCWYYSNLKAWMNVKIMREVRGKSKTYCYQ